MSPSTGPTADSRTGSAGRRRAAQRGSATARRRRHGQRRVGACCAGPSDTAPASGHDVRGAGRGRHYPTGGRREQSPMPATKGRPGSPVVENVGGWASVVDMAVAAHLTPAGQVVARMAVPRPWNRFPPRHGAAQFSTNGVALDQCRAPGASGSSPRPGRWPGVGAPQLAGIVTCRSGLVGLDHVDCSSVSRQISLASSAPSFAPSWTRNSMKPSPTVMSASQQAPR